MRYHDILVITFTWTTPLQKIGPAIGPYGTRPFVTDVISPTNYHRDPNTGLGATKAIGAIGWTGHGVQGHERLTMNRSGIVATGGSTWPFRCMLSCSARHPAVHISYLTNFASSLLVLVLLIELLPTRCKATWPVCCMLSGSALHPVARGRKRKRQARL